jgi:hypothetical protein
MKTRLAVAAAVALVTLVGVNRVSVTPLLAQDRVATVLTQVRTALGGEPKLAAVKAMSAEGPFRRAMGSRSVEGNTALLIVRPDKLRRSEESKMFGSTAERISTFDGAQAWEEMVSAARVGGGGGFDHGGGGGGALTGQAATDHAHAMAQFQDHDHAESGSPASGGVTQEQANAARIRRMKMELQRWTIAFLADSSQPFTDAGRAESPDGPADVIETKDEAGRAVRYFIDPASHMPLMVQYQEVRPQALAAPPAPGGQGDPDAARRRIEEMRAQGAPKMSTVAVHLADYKKVDGVMLPHQIDISINGQASESWTIENFKINPTVKANVFQKKAK